MSWLPCTVRVRDGVIVHQVEVQAESIYEACALGLRELRRTEWSQQAADDAVRIEVEVQRPPVIHSVRLETLKAWASSSGPPKDMIERARIRELMEN